MIPLGVLASGYVAPAGSSWTPSDMAGLLAWWDGSDASTITESGGLVSKWADKSGNGFDGTRGTSTMQPTTGSVTLNGLAVISFDGGDELYTPIPTPTDTGSLGIFVVGYDTADNSRWLSENVTDGWTQAWRGGLFSGGAIYSYSPKPPTSTWAVHSYSFLGASGATIRDNGVQTASTTAAMRTEWATGAYIGSRNGTFYLTGNIAEIVVASSLDDVANVESYLMTKWGIP